MNPIRYRQQLIIVGLLLLVISIASYIWPSVGPLAIGANVVLIIEITRVRYPKNALSVALLVISVLVLFWGWISPNIESLSNPMALVMVISWFAYCLKVKPLTNFFTKSTSCFLVFLLSIFVFVTTEYQLIKPLLRGYDNNAHLPALSQVFRHGGFIYSGKLPINFTFGNYVNGYPPLQQSTWAFIMSLTNVQITGGYEIIRYFSFFFLGTGILAIALIVGIWTSIPAFNSRLLVKAASVSTLFVLVALSSANFILWQGFPPFLWACCIIIATLNLMEAQRNPVVGIILGFTGLTLVNYSYPLISPALLLVVLFQVAKLSRSDLTYIKTFRWKLTAVAITVAAFNTPVVLKTLNVKDYLNDDGGIQPVDLFILFLMLLVISLTLFLYRQPLKLVPIHVIAFFSATINFAVFAFISQLESGYISYYPAKAGYLALILGFASLGAIQFRQQNTATRLPTRAVRNFALVVAIGVLIVSVGRTLDNHSEPASTHKILADLADEEPNPRTLCFLNAMQLTADLNSNESNTQILFLQDDLLTRWINGVRGRLIDATYSLSISVGQGQQTLPEIFEWWTIQFPNIEVVILAPEMPPGLEKWKSIVQFREFSCA
jgi:hypothetical protein